MNKEPTERNEELAKEIALDLSRRVVAAADSGRRYLAAINTGGIGVTFAVAGHLVSKGVEPSWAVIPIALFAFGLVLTGISWQVQKYQSKERWNAALKEDEVPNFSHLLTNWYYDALALAAFVVAVFVGLWALHGISLPELPAPG